MVGRGEVVRRVKRRRLVCVVRSMNAAVGFDDWDSGWDRRLVVHRWKRVV